MSDNYASGVWIDEIESDLQSLEELAPLQWVREWVLTCADIAIETGVYHV